MTRRLTWVVIVVVALLAALVVGRSVWRQLDRSDFERAVDLLPADTLRASWTDWSGVRAALGSGEPTEPDAIRGFIENAFTGDLSASSTIDESAAAMSIAYGVSPANADWELFAQSRDGAVMLLKVPESVDLDALEGRLEGLGYTRPARADGVWEGGEDVIVRIDPTITPELEYVAVLADQRLLVTSDGADYLETALDAIQGDADSLDADSLHGLAGAVDEPLSATAFVGDFACEALAMSQADTDQQAAATQLIAQAGGINPLRGLVVAAYADFRLRVAMAFENDDQAKANGSSRSVLASGLAPGQGLDYPDLFELTEAQRDGATVTFDLAGRSDAYAMSSLISGPVLFESC